jgi:hypothetical protein
MALAQRSVTIRGTRTDCHTGESRDVECELELRETARFGWIVLLTKGAITGFEYFSATEGARFGDGWNACVGTKDEYDSLAFTGSEMRRALAALGLRPGD